MKWTHQYDQSEPYIEMEISKDATLSEVLEAFEHFLQAVGYGINGHLEITNDSSTKKEIQR